MAEVFDLEVVDADNTARFPEAMALSAVNNGARALEGLLARHHKDVDDSVVTTGGSSTAYTVAATRTIASYHDGLTQRVQFHTACGASPTANIDSVGAGDLYWPDKTQVGDGEIPSGFIADLVYDLGNTRFEVHNLPFSPGTVATLTGTQTLTNKTLTSPVLNTSISGTAFLDEDNMASDAADKVASQQSIKAYVDAVSVPSAASQAQQETGSATNVYVSPGRQQYHPSAAKFWVKCDIAGNVDASYNVTSITDTGTGDVLVTIATDFSSADWTAISVPHSNSPVIPCIGTQAAGTVQLLTFNIAGTANDPVTGHFAAGFGDQ